MLKAQIARALQLPSDVRAEQGLLLLRGLDDEPADAAPPDAGGAPDPAKNAAPAEKHGMEDRDCDRMIAALRARLAAR